LGNVTSPLLPKTQRLLNDLGNRLKLARLRRGLEAKQVAERAGMAPLTLRSIERGSSTVTFGAYVAVMQVLGLAEDLNSVAKEDETGRHLQDAKLTQPKPRKRVERKDDNKGDRAPEAHLNIEKAKGVRATPVKPKRNATQSVGSQAVPPMPAPKKSVSTKKVTRSSPGRETEASKLAAQIFKSGDK
jgi:transcriptional regulator with XRE-family HTH domain